MSRTIYYSSGGFRSGSKVYCRFEPDSGSMVIHPLAHHVQHSPDGHSWGYGGSGPSELAKDILWDLLGEEPPQRVYMEFKWQFIAGLPQDEGWEIGSDVIKTWLLAEFPDFFRDWRARRGT